MPRRHTCVNRLTSLRRALCREPTRRIARRLLGDPGTGRQPQGPLTETGPGEPLGIAGVLLWALSSLDPPAPGIGVATLTIMGFPASALPAQ